MIVWQATFKRLEKINEFKNCCLDIAGLMLDYDLFSLTINNALFYIITHNVPH